jgi:hypothetical protein
MYQVIDGPEYVRIDPTQLRPFFKSALKKVHKACQTPEAFRAWHKTRCGAGWEVYSECSPIKWFVRSLISRQMEVRGNLDGTITICDWRHSGSVGKPTVVMNLPAWVWKFMTEYFDAWTVYHQGIVDTEYIVDGRMPYDAVYRLLDQAYR